MMTAKRRRTRIRPHRRVLTPDSARDCSKRRSAQSNAVGLASSFLRDRARSRCCHLLEQLTATSRPGFLLAIAKAVGHAFDAVGCIAARLQMRSKAMKEKKDIVENWLPRYTGTPLAEFGAYVLLTNFDNYAEWFAKLYGAAVKGLDRPMPNVTSDGITLINFGMGSPNAATVMHLVMAIAPKAVVFLGKCGGLKRKNQICELILPIAALSGESNSD